MVNDQNKLIEQRSIKNFIQIQVKIYHNQTQKQSLQPSQKDNIRYNDVEWTQYNQQSISEKPNEQSKWKQSSLLVKNIPEKNFRKEPQVPS